MSADASVRGALIACPPRCSCLLLFPAPLSQPRTLSGPPWMANFRPSPSAISLCALRRRGLQAPRATYSLKGLQSRFVAALLADTDRNRFIVGTCSLREENEARLFTPCSTLWYAAKCENGLRRVIKSVVRIFRQCKCMHPPKRPSGRGTPGVYARAAISNPCGRVPGARG